MKQVHSFEPNPIPYKILRQKTKRFNNVCVYNSALSSTASHLSLNIPVDHKGNQITTRGSINTIDLPHISIDVPVNTLDSYSFNDVSFMKIDVEGHEQSVLEGSANTIISSKPVLLVETESISVIHKILSWGYSCYKYNKGKLLPVDAGVDFNSAKETYINLFFLPNN